MRHRTLKALALAALFGLGSLSFAAEGERQPAKEKAPKAAKTEQANNAKKAKVPAPKLVDINGASKAELKKLPGVGDAEADKIVAGRPYRTKAELAVRSILPRGVYEQLKGQIIAKQRG